MVMIVAGRLTGGRRGRCGVLRLKSILSANPAIWAGIQAIYRD
jgi:hypothetical protein